MIPRLLIALTLLTTTASLAACGGMACDDPTDPRCSPPDKVGQAQQRMAAPLPTMECGGLWCGAVTSSMTGQGTSSCSGSETVSWGDSTRGGYQHVTCDYWYMSEWGSGWYMNDWGACKDGIMISGSYDSTAL